MLDVEGVMTVLGVVTIGQSPRSDMVPEMPMVADLVEVRERGALDGLSAADLKALAPEPGDETLTTRLRDGSSVVIGRAGILPRLQSAIDILEVGRSGRRTDRLHRRVPAVPPQPSVAAGGPLLTAGCPRWRATRWSG